MTQISELFQVTDVAGSRVLWVNSDHLEASLDAYQASEFSALGISRVQGYTRSDLQFLAYCPFVRGLHIVEADPPLSLRPLKHLKNLTELVISGDCKELTLADFPKLEEFRGYWHPSLLSDHSTLRLLDVSKYKSASRDLTKLPILPSLKTLALVQGNVESLLGIGSLPGLERVELAYLSKLKDLHGLESLAHLRWLDFQQCRKLANTEEVVSTLRKLVVLRLNMCAQLKSLRFLDELPALEEFRFVDTDVEDGDLSPLIRLQRVGFLRKRHFSHTPEEIDALIAAHKEQSATVTKGA